MLMNLITLNFRAVFDTGSSIAETLIFRPVGSSEEDGDDTKLETDFNNGAISETNYTKVDPGEYE